eukprot:maker-scaffold_58-snap-gene-0.16-mRNA-1 protein AED:0.24 eAED:0.25 QI:0/0/0/1/0/0/2/0/308
MPHGAKIYRLVELFSKKYDSIEKKTIYKVRMAADGKMMDARTPTYAPVSTFEAIRLFIANAAHLNHHILQLDVANTFLNAELPFTTYLQLSMKYYKERKSYVWSTSKAVYGLKESSRAWFQELHNTLESIGVISCLVEKSLYRWKKDGETLGFIISYVDDFQNLDDGNALLKKISKAYAIKSTNQISKFVGFEITNTNKNMKLCIQKYIVEVVRGYELQESNPVQTPHQTGLYPTKGSQFIQSTLLQSIIETLLYICRTVRPDISFIVNRLSIFAQSPTIEHLRMARTIVKYLLSNSNLSIKYEKRTE